jgi:hypothetical protein
MKGKVLTGRRAVQASAQQRDREVVQAVSGRVDALARSTARTWRLAEDSDDDARRACEASAGGLVGKIPAGFVADFEDWPGGTSDYGSSR